MPNALAMDDPMTPEWLTEALRAADALPIGAVIAVETRANAAFNSAAAHLTLTYSADAPAEAPRALFLKRNLKEEWAIETGRYEVAFYKAMEPRRADLPMLIPCYAALVDEARGASTLLMLDVSATHAPLLTSDERDTTLAIPTPVALDAAIDMLAVFHAACWERPELAAQFETNSWYSDASSFAAHVARRQQEWAQLVTEEGDALPADLSAFYTEQALPRLPLLWEQGLGERITTRRGLTLSHGDCYLTQFLYPRPGVTAPTYLVDFGGEVGLPGDDLVHMFAFWWSRAQRQEGDLEIRCLRRYHAGLLAGGVRDYAWDDLLADYRCALTLMLFYPVWDETNGSARSYWLPKMRNIVAAYQDHCLT